MGRATPLPHPRIGSPPPARRRFPSKRRPVHEPGSGPGSRAGGNQRSSTYLEAVAADARRLASTWRPCPRRLIEVLPGRRTATLVGRDPIGDGPIAWRPSEWCALDPATRPERAGVGPSSLAGWSRSSQRCSACRGGESRVRPLGVRQYARREGCALVIDREVDLAENVLKLAGGGGGQAPVEPGTTWTIAGQPGDGGRELHHWPATETCSKALPEPLPPESPALPGHRPSRRRCNRVGAACTRSGRQVKLADPPPASLGGAWGWRVLKGARARSWPGLVCRRLLRRLRDNNVGDALRCRTPAPLPPACGAEGPACSFSSRPVGAGTAGCPGSGRSRFGDG